MLGNNVTELFQIIFMEFILFIVILNQLTSLQYQTVSSRHSLHSNAENHSNVINMAEYNVKASRSNDNGSKCEY